MENGIDQDDLKAPNGTNFSDSDKKVLLVKSGIAINEEINSSCEDQNRNELCKINSDVKDLSLTDSVEKSEYDSMDNNTTVINAEPVQVSNVVNRVPECSTEKLTVCQDDCVISEQRLPKSGSTIVDALENFENPCSHKELLSSNNSEISVSAPSDCYGKEPCGQDVIVSKDSEKKTMIDKIRADSSISQEHDCTLVNKISSSEKLLQNMENLPSMYVDDSDSSYEFDSEIECDNSENGDATTSIENSIGLPMRRNNFKTSRINRSKAAVEYYEVQLQFLENSNKKLLKELEELKQNLLSQETMHKRNENQLQAEYEAKLEKLSKLCEASKKEKEAMVVKYAGSEKEVICLKKSCNEFERKLRESNKDKENLSNKLKSLQSERSRLCANIEQKVSETGALQREYEKLKEEVSCKDIKIKWVQNKLKTEMDAHKETQAKLEHAMHRLHEMREEAEQVRRDCQEMIRRYQEAEEIKSVELDHQLRQKLSELEVQRQERCDQEEVYQLLRQELEALKKKQRITIEENNSLTLKIHSLEKERLEYEQTLSKLKDNQNSLKQEVVDLTAHLAEMENLKLQLEREKEKYSASVREVERLRQTNAELQSDMDACHLKEGELLEFTEKLTAKTVHLQSEHSLIESKAQALEEEVSQLNKQQTEMKQKILNLTTLLDDEKKQRSEETQLLARKLAEKTKAGEQLVVKLDEAENENTVLKRRHIASIKELSRELQQYRKRVELCECASCPPAVPEKSGLGSRASSSASLDNMNNPCINPIISTNISAPQVSPPVSFSGGKILTPAQNLLPVAAIPTEVNKQMLVERIVKLQKNLAKRNDKIEFLEDHITQLVKEMKKKSKIIQNYVVKIEAGALTPSSSDQNKMDLAKKGGIMASVYRSQPSDTNMTLDLSLEINNKLQAVLEDTLLKNITLKENINTLGEEIAQLTSEKRELNRQLTKSKSVK